MTLSLDTYGGPLLDKGLPGMEVDINVSSIANYNNGPTFDLAVGIAVAVAPNGLAVLPVIGQPIAGVTVRHVTFMVSSDMDAMFFPPNAPVPIMESGRIWAYCKDGCNVGDAVKCDIDGSLSAVSGAIVVDGARWDSVAAAGEIAILRLNRQWPTAGATGTLTEEEEPLRSAPGRPSGATGARDDDKGPGADTKPGADVKPGPGADGKPGSNN
jgi:hypothetical protein